MDIPHLMLTLVQSVAAVIAAAFFLYSWGAFRKLVLKETTAKEKLALTLFFGGLGILGTYAGTPIMGAIANLRAIGVIVGGLFGGPIVGLGAGLLAGGHRILIDIGGFSSLPCGISTMVEGAAAGLIAMRLHSRVLDWRVGTVLAILGESFHMGLCLVMIKSLTDAWALIRLIAIPMIVVNAMGVGIFVQIVKAGLRDRERRASSQAHQALDIANKTVSYLRSGLNLESARITARIIYESFTVAAVSITDTQRVLAYIGAGEDHHEAGQEIQTASCKKVIAEGGAQFIRSKAGIGCREPNCPLESAVLVPLRKRGEIVGVLKLYGDRSHVLHNVDVEMALGLANLFSTQLELEDIHIKEQLLARAEIKWLQSQINPHFMFNALNTIGSLCRTNPEQAKEVLLELSCCLRKNIRPSKEFVRVKEELEHVKSYLNIEQARFGDRVRASFRVDPECEHFLIPPLIIQPLVENAVRHGISRLESGGEIVVSVQRHGNELRITVQDNGRGCDDLKSDPNGQPLFAEAKGNGVGITNIHQRLVQIYGPGHGLKISSNPGLGTSVFVSIPIDCAMEEAKQDENAVPAALEPSPAAGQSGQGDEPPTLH